MYAAVAVRYRLGGGDWIFAVIELTIVAGFILAAAILLRRPGVALPGLLGGLVVALTWLAMQGFTFYDVIAPWTAPFWPLVPMVAVPVLVGVARALRAGSAVGRPRIARLAALSAGLAYLYGPSRSRCRRQRAGQGTRVDGQSHHRRPARQQRDLRAAVYPLVTVTIGWAAAAVTARIRRAWPPGWFPCRSRRPAQPVRRAVIR